jgi:CheY-like chemotaxis protein
MQEGDGKGDFLDIAALCVITQGKPSTRIHPLGVHAAMPKHILCADDSVTMQKVVAITFAHTDYQVTSARSADEALNLARQSRPDLVLADAIMNTGGGKSGYELCQAVKSDPALRQVPVVIVCGNSQPYDETRGRQVGADGTLAKPWDTQVFIEKVGEILSRVATHGVAHAAAAPLPPVVTPPRMPSSPGPGHGAAPARPPLGASAGLGAAPRPTIPSATPAGGGLGVRPAAPPAGIPPRPMGPPGAVPGAGLPKPPAGLPRPPLIRGAAISARPASGNVAQVPGAAPRPLGTPAPVAAPRPAPGGLPPPIAAAPTAPPPATQARPQRTATIMGMPAMAMPPGLSQPTPVPSPPIAAPPAPAPVGLPPPLAARPQPAPPVVPAAPMAPPAAPTPPVAPPAPRPLPGTDALAKAAQRVAAAGMLATQQAVEARGGDPRGVEYEAIAKLSREIIEKIAWEVVPELAEIIIRERLNELKK